jgi:hypothetical protein
MASAKITPEGAGTHHCWTTCNEELGIVGNEHCSIPIKLAIMGELGSHDPDVVVEDLHIAGHVYRSFGRIR